MGKTLTDGNEPAYGYGFQENEQNPSYGRGSSKEFIMRTKECKGLTKREYFAAMAMQGLIAANYSDINGNVLVAVQHADALIAELNKTPS